jgi:oligopeptide/dipeptide ABC transporter ATP-binding protein
MTPLLQVIDLVKHFEVRTAWFGRHAGHDGGRVRAVDGVSFSVAAGETFAIVGESGCGKSTVARLALRLIEPTSGRILLDGEDLTAFDAARLRGARGRLQIIFQDPYGSLNPRMTVGAMMDEPMMLHSDLTAAQRRARVGELLAVVGLRAEAVRRYPHEFSGGQRQRLAIARALACEPRVIFCDEPVSALDVSIQAQILNLLADLQRRFGLAFVFISHDLAVVRHIATRLAVMYLGRLVEVGPAARIFERPRHPYTHALLNAVPMPVPGARARASMVRGDVPSPMAPPSGCRFHTRCPHAVERCRNETPPLEPAGDGIAVACHLWRAIDPPDFALHAAVKQNPILARLQAAFASNAGARPAP